MRPVVRRKKGEGGVKPYSGLGPSKNVCEVRQICINGTGVNGAINRRENQEGPYICWGVPRFERDPLAGNRSGAINPWRKEFNGIWPSTFK